MLHCERRGPMSKERHQMKISIGPCTVFSILVISTKFHPNYKFNENRIALKYSILAKCASDIVSHWYSVCYVQNVKNLGYNNRFFSKSVVWISRNPFWFIKADIYSVGVLFVIYSVVIVRSCYKNGLYYININIIELPEIWFQIYKISLIH